MLALGTYFFAWDAFNAISMNLSGTEVEAQCIDVVWELEDDQFPTDGLQEDGTVHFSESENAYPLLKYFYKEKAYEYQMTEVVYKNGELLQIGDFTTLLINQNNLDSKPVLKNIGQTIVLPLISYLVCLVFVFFIGRYIYRM